MLLLPVIAFLAVIGARACAGLAIGRAVPYPIVRAWQDTQYRLAAWRPYVVALGQARGRAVQLPRFLALVERSYLQLELRRRLSMAELVTLAVKAGFQLHQLDQLRSSSSSGSAGSWARPGGSGADASAEASTSGRPEAAEAAAAAAAAEIAGGAGQEASMQGNETQGDVYGAASTSAAAAAAAATAASLDVAISAFQYARFAVWYTRHLELLWVLRRVYAWTRPQIVAGFGVARRAAEAALAGQPAGTFCLRLGSPPGVLALTVLRRYVREGYMEWQRRRRRHHMQEQQRLRQRLRQQAGQLQPQPQPQLQPEPLPLPYWQQQQPAAEEEREHVPVYEHYAFTSRRLANPGALVDILLHEVRGCLYLLDLSDGTLISRPELLSILRRTSFH